MKLSERLLRLERNLQRERSFVEGVLYFAAVLFRYKLPIFMVTGSMAGAAVAFSLWSLATPPNESVLPNHYTAGALLLIADPSNDVNTALRASLDIPISRPREDARRDLGQTALLVLESRFVTDRLIEEFGIPRRYELATDERYNARKAIRERAEFTYDLSSGALMVEYTDIDPEFAKVMANRMVDLLDEWFSESHRATQAEHREFLEQTLTEVSARIKTLEGQIEEFQRRYGALSVEELSASLTSRLSDLQSQLLAREMEIRNRDTSPRIEDPELDQLRRERDNLREVIRQTEQGQSGGGREMPSIDELPVLARDFRSLSSELDTQRTIHTALARQYELLKLTDATPEVFRVVERAEAPQRKSGPSRGKLCVLATFGAFFTSVLLSLLHSAFRSAATRVTEEKNRCSEERPLSPLRLSGSPVSAMPYGLRTGPQDRE